MKNIAFVVVCFVCMIIGIQIHSTWEFFDSNRTPICYVQLKVIDSLAKQIKVEAERSHMVLSHMKEDTVYVPMSNMDVIIDLAEEINKRCYR